MKCHRIQEQLEKDALWLLLPEEREALRVHVAQCAACRAAQTETRAVAGRFKSAFVEPSNKAVLDKLRWRMQCEATGVRRAMRRRHFMRRLVRLAACLVLAVGVGCLAWPQIRSVCMGRFMGQDWQVAGVQPVDASGVAQPLVCGTQVITLQQNEKNTHLVAFDRQTGERLWRVQAKFEGGLATDGAHVFSWVRDAEGLRQMAAYDVVTGQESWRLPYPDASSTARPREIVVGGDGVGWADQASVIWLSVRDGHCQWVSTLGGEGAQRPKIVVVSGCVVVMGMRQVCALSMARGEVLWSRALDPGIANWQEPRVSGDGNFLAMARGIGPATDRLTCLDLRTGCEIWSHDITAPTRHLLFQNGVLYVRGQETMALNGRTGDRLWSLSVAGCSPLTLADGKLYLVAGSRGVLAVDPATGMILWRSTTLASCSGVAVAGRMGYVRTLDGVLHAIRLSVNESRAKTKQPG